MLCPAVQIRAPFFLQGRAVFLSPSLLKDEAGFGRSFLAKWLSHKPRGELLLLLPLSQQSEYSSAESAVPHGLANPYQ